MLVKLNRNKLLIITSIFFTSFSCGRSVYNTEILCPDGSKILVRYAKEDEIRAAIQKNYDDKKKYGTSDKHTVIRLPKERSFRIERIPPEEMIKCYLRQVPLGKNDKQYIHYF